MDIDLGKALASAHGNDLEDIIANPTPRLKLDGTPWRVRFDGPEHILTIGPTRSGKGRRLLAPELLRDTDRSIIVVDPKGELAGWTALHRQACGNEVVALDPFGVLAEMPHLRLPSSGYNPMRWLDPDSQDFVDDATVIAEAICPVENQREPHWDEGAQDILTGLIMYDRIVNPAASLADVRRDLASTRDQWRDMIIGMGDFRRRDGKDAVLALDKHHPRIYEKLAELSEFTDDDRELKGLIRSARTKTRFLDSPAIIRDMDGDGIDFSTLKTHTENGRPKPITVYLVLPPVRLVTHARWLRLVISGAIEALRKVRAPDSRPDTLIILDEFPQLGRMQTVETGVQLNAGYGIKFWVVVQNITQIKALYEDNWETFASAGVLTSFAPRDPTTSEYLAKIGGEKTIRVQGESTDEMGHKTTSLALQRREDIMPHQFRRMKQGMLFVRLPSRQKGEAIYITDVEDFTGRPDSEVPPAVKAIGAFRII
jgi:type IV secretion system protein VirD4